MDVKRGHAIERRGAGFGREGKNGGGGEARPDEKPNLGPTGREKIHINLKARTAVWGPLQ